MTAKMIVPTAAPGSATSWGNLTCLQYASALGPTMSNFTSSEVGLFMDYCGYNTTDGPHQDRSIVLEVTDYIRIPMYFVIFVVCVLGNSLVIITLLQNRRMRTVTNIFLINLSVGDLLLGVFCMPPTLTGQILKRFLFGAAMCKMIPYLQVVSVAVSTFTLCSISIERYFAICCPLTSRRWQTVSHAVKMTIVCWLLAFFIAFPILLTSRYEKYGHIDGVDYYSCREVYYSEELDIAYNVTLFIVLFGLPGIFMTLAYVKITLTLLRAGIKGDDHPCAAKESIAYPANDVPTNGSLAKLSNKLARFRAGSNGHQSMRDARNGSTAGLAHQTTIGENGDVEATPTAVTSPAESNYAKSPLSAGQGGGVRSTNSERNLQAKKRVVLMLIIVVFEFFICFTPLYLVNIIGMFDPKGVKAHLGDQGIPYLQLLMYISTCCNPITYCFLHSKFRQGMIQAFKCKKNDSGANDLLRSRTTKLMSYHKNDSISAKSLNNISMPLNQNPGKIVLPARSASIPNILEVDEDCLSKYAATSVNQSTEITWL